MVSLIFDKEFTYMGLCNPEDRSSWLKKGFIVLWIKQTLFCKIMKSENFLGEIRE